MHFKPDELSLPHFVSLLTPQET